MAGSRESSLRAAATTRRKHGDDFFKEAGRLGGAAPTAKPKGFAASGLASEAGKKGGAISKRRKKTNEPRE